MDDFLSKYEGDVINGLTIDAFCYPMEGRSPSFYPRNDVTGWSGSDCYRFMIPLAPEK